MSAPGRASTTRCDGHSFDAISPSRSSPSSAIGDAFATPTAKKVGFWRHCCPVGGLPWSAPWSAAKPVRLLKQSRPNAPVNAIVEPRVLVGVKTCAGTWCYVRAQAFSGYVRQSRLWGVYPGEAF
ncbi:SH3 domain-containing protein [uncultured Bradyrhizobium sp.]|uniref:SH3 domain-containing protein n=1 Tax=uncultured Bradyrhizobium sp. TaxID=199684 RepID=UPI00261859A2|nr:SH3 domain-containing protein [uncultured Bradyrhizobium sp.]